MTPSLSFQRFSSPPQQKGNSEERQNDVYIAFCERHNLAQGEIYIDRGLSAFTGKHREKGEFGRFLAAVQANKIPKGTVLVIESWDRFSRETTGEALIEMRAKLKTLIRSLVNEIWLSISDSKRALVKVKFRQSWERWIRIDGDESKVTLNGDLPAFKQFICA